MAARAAIPGTSPVTAPSISAPSCKPAAARPAAARPTPSTSRPRAALNDRRQQRWRHRDGRQPAPALGGTLANIIGGVIIGNISGAGTTSLTLDDSGDTQARTATLSEGSLAGIAPGSIQWFDDQAGGASSGGVTALKVLGGSGANTYTVADAGAANVATTLSTGKGNDTVNVLGSAAPLRSPTPAAATTSTWARNARA